MEVDDILDDIFAQNRRFFVIHPAANPDEYYAPRNALCLGSRGSEVQILSPRPKISKTYKFQFVRGWHFVHNPKRDDLYGFFVFTVK
jgi:hypothetical protein